MRHALLRRVMGDVTMGGVMGEMHLMPSPFLFLAAVRLCELQLATAQRRKHAAFSPTRLGRAPQGGSTHGSAGKSCPAAWCAAAGALSPLHCGAGGDRSLLQMSRATAAGGAGGREQGALYEHAS